MILLCVVFLSVFFFYLNFHIASIMLLPLRAKTVGEAEERVKEIGSYIGNIQCSHSW